jgi:diguanylate cyclase (GGDEF)-like protein
MSLPYLMFGYAAAVLLLFAGLYAVGRAVPGLRGLNYLRYAILSGLASVLLFALLFHAPDWVPILCGNGALFACVFFIYCATVEVLSAPPRFLPYGIGVLAVAEGGLAWFTYAHPNPLARILVVSAAMMIYAGATAALLFTHAKADDNTAVADSGLETQAKALGVLQVLNGLDHVVRAVLSFVYPPTGYVRMDNIQAGFSYMNMLLNAAAMCGVVWLAHSVNRRALHRTARTDGMTGLLNRRAFEEFLERDLRRAALDGKPVWLIMLDIDHFKSVNDSLGHQAGDDVIRSVASALTRCLRPMDIPCRIGGEEFAILLHVPGAGDATDVSERIREEIAGTQGLPGGIRITASFGVAPSLSGDTFEDLMRRSDSELYASKRNGRNRVTVHGVAKAGGDSNSASITSMPQRTMPAGR